jgi:hypothetical protein
MALLGTFLGRGLLLWLVCRVRRVLLVGSAAALMSAASSGEPLLAHWT